MTRYPSDPTLVTIFGGSGFLGRHVVQALARRGFRIRVACRNPNTSQHLQPLGDVGQIQAVKANIRDEQSIARVCRGADHVVNLVGILAESGRQTFDAVQHEGTADVARAAAENGAGFTLVSAIGADEQSASAYARAKAKGEQAVFDAVPNAVVLRPSIMFGPEDSFFNRFAEMARFSPALPLIAGGETKLQPVYVADVAEVVARSVAGELEGGKVYELGGPEIFSFKELMEIVLEETDRKRFLAPVPMAIARVLGAVGDLIPFGLAPITSDQVKQLENDNVVSEEARKEGRTLEGLGIVPHTVRAVIPSYIWRYRVEGEFSRGHGPV
ncbi:complex I NDUFA9 subunit family protein [Notoacmeibacter sp. MSK16QG-6]|uniref:complex I NDUFA9 subunit family protein n=1 Tax=Notoacmeibacter sp. MSK16QG-6 TaxID=2957982 RepID=UPI00209C7A91|nr:complex I NDUFA9 subunit family protein [Notoacmeibacter sp. MSK16QG-6]MCP1198845.1 complex I NDUFA9 subunit family protein [Notoacmeibacter sp. MSK16QG-6]